MDRKYQVAFCKVCENHKIDQNKGVICGLTNDVAKFKVNCFNFKGDRKLTPYADPYSKNNIIEKTEVIESKNTNEQEIIDEYPPKPQIPDKKVTIQQSIISFILFVSLVYFVFGGSLLYVLVLAGILFIHELGHLLAMKFFKYKDTGIFFIPLISAAASGTSKNVTQKQRLRILLAGPLPGIIIGLILYYYGLKLNDDFLNNTGQMFLFINAFNLLPILPLDGGNIVKTVYIDSNELGNTIFTILSIIILSYIFLTSRSYILLIVPILLALQLNKRFLVKKVRDILKEKEINYHKDFDELTDEEYWEIRDVLLNNNDNLRRYAEPGKFITSNNEQIIVSRVKKVLAQQTKKNISVVGEIFIVIYWISTFILILYFIVDFHHQFGLLE
jgi:Zn-dependent protease